MWLAIVAWDGQLQRARSHAVAEIIYHDALPVTFVDEFNWIDVQVIQTPFVLLHAVFIAVIDGFVVVVPCNDQRIAFDAGDLYTEP